MMAFYPVSLPLAPSLLAGNISRCQHHAVSRKHTKLGIREINPYLVVIDKVKPRQ